MLFNLQGSSRAALLINDGAFDSFKRVLSLTPNRAKIYYTRKNIQKKMDAWEAAIDNFKQAPKIKPGYAEAYCNIAFAFLKRGDFAAGWQDYDWRWKKAKLNSDPLNGQTCIAPEKSGALSSVCVLGQSMGAPHVNSSHSERLGEYDFGLDRALVYG